MVEWFLPSDGCICLTGVGHTFAGEEISAITTITCPLCANTHEILSQPASIGWKQVACSSCEANLVLVRGTSSSPLRQQKSAMRLKLVPPGARQSRGIVGSRLLIAVITILALGLLGYLFFETDLLSDIRIPL